MAEMMMGFCCVEVFGCFVSIVDFFIFKKLISYLKVLSQSEPNSHKISRSHIHVDVTKN